MIGSLIGMFLTAVLFLIGAYLFSVNIDYLLHTRNTYDSLKTVELKYFGWLFLRSKKTEKNKIYLISFILEIFSVILLLVTFVTLILSIVLKEELILLIDLVLVFLYFCNCLILHSLIQKNKSHY